MSVANDPARTGPAAAAVRTLDITDDLYPPLLRAIHDPPARLYVRGDPAILQQPLLAIVGSRRASSAGLRAARTLSAGLSGAGLHSCSGLALGIDGAAHRGSLDVGGKSVAVMATGIDRVYPQRHRQLAGELALAGCLVTEFPPGTPPRRGNFPRRNRIISGLSLGVLVIEAALPSGSLITANSALDQGREVFTLPWSVFHRGGEGCLRLLRDGAKMVQRVEDVIEELSALYALQQELFTPLADQAKGNDAVASGLQQLLELVGDDEVTVDELAGRTELPVAQLLADLSTLELQGLVERRAGSYVRCR